MLILYLAIAGAADKPPKPGYWSKTTFAVDRRWDFADGTDLRPTRISAPDGQLFFIVSSKSVMLDGEKTTVPDIHVVREGKRLDGLITADVNPEMAWSPDSKALFITSSDGGAVGTWHVDVYLVEPPRIRRANVIKTVRNDLRARYPACVAYKGIQSCSEEDSRTMNATSDWVNVIGVEWLNGSEELIVAALVPNSSSYGANMGEWMGYRLEISSGTILQRYTRSEFRERWQALTKAWN